MGWLLDRWQRWIVLPESTWRNKILLRHPEMVDNEDAIGLALVDPDEVRFDRDHADREVYYRRGALPPPNTRDYLKVVVEFEATATGERLGRIVTAYPTDAIKRRERPKWKR